MKLGYLVILDGKDGLIYEDFESAAGAFSEGQLESNKCTICRMAKNSGGVPARTLSYHWHSDISQWVEQL